MQMKLTTDCALRMLVYLAIKEKVVNSKEISDTLHIPQKNVLSIGRALKITNYLNIISGPYGGYELNKNPEDILLYDIFSIFESAKINYHFEQQKGNTIIIDTAMNNLQSGLQNAIEKKLKSETLADLIMRSKENSAESKRFSEM